MCAVRGGQSVDTTMGLTPLEGLVMGTRCGELDRGGDSWRCGLCWAGHRGSATMRWPVSIL